MRTSKNFPLATFALLVIATQKDGANVKSSTLSSLLEVSDSSLKKLMRRLVEADLVESTASRSGGYRLKRPLSQITMADVLVAVEGVPVLETPDTGLAMRVFEEKDGVEAAQNLVSSTFGRCEDALLQQFSEVTLDRFLKRGEPPDDISGDSSGDAIDWNVRALQIACEA